MATVVQQLQWVCVASVVLRRGVFWLFHYVSATTAAAAIAVKQAAGYPASATANCQFPCSLFCTLPIVLHPVYSCCAAKTLHTTHVLHHWPATPHVQPCASACEAKTGTIGKARMPPTPQKSIRGSTTDLYPRRATSCFCVPGKNSESTPHGRQLLPYAWSLSIKLSEPSGSRYRF